MTMRRITYLESMEAGKVKEVATQTEESQFKVDHFKKTVEAISAHKTEGKRMGVRFMVKWQGYFIYLPERSDTIIAKGGRQILIDYLLKVQKNDRRKFAFMLTNQPDLAELLKEPLMAQAA